MSERPTRARRGPRRYVGLFTLFVVINDFIRPTFLFLDVVLNVYQDLGILADYWLYWPEAFDVIFAGFSIALFDINIFEPTCVWPDWNSNDEFFLMCFTPLIYAAYAGLRLWLRKQRTPEDFVRAGASCLRYLISAQASLADVVLAPWLCQNFRGMSPRLRRVEAPELSCDDPKLNYIRPIAFIYMLVFVLAIPFHALYHLVVLRRRNLLRDRRVLAKYGWLYEDFKPSALYWTFAQQTKQLVLIIARVVLWAYPLAQGYVALAVLLLCLWLQASLSPYRKPVLNAFEQTGLCLTLLLAALGLLFTSEYLDADERRGYINTYFALQGLYLGVAIYFVHQQVRDVRAGQVAGYVVQYVGELQARKMVAQPRKMSHSDSTLRGQRIKWVARLGGSASPKGPTAQTYSRDLDEALCTRPSTARYVEPLSESASGSFGWTPSGLLRAALDAAKRNTQSTRQYVRGASSPFAVARRSSTRVVDTLEERRHEVVRSSLLERFGHDAEEGWARCRELLEEPPTEVLASFKGSVLLDYVKTAQFADDAKAEVVALYHLEDVLGPYLSSESWTSVYSNEPLASFYRSLHAFMPSLVDVLLDATPQRRKTLAAAVSLLAREYEERRAGIQGQGAGRGADIAASTLHNSRRASLLFFLLHAPRNHYELAAAFMRKLVVASPSRRTLRANYVRYKSVVKVQRAFRRRKLIRLGVLSSPGGGKGYVEPMLVRRPSATRMTSVGSVGSSTKTLFHDSLTEHEKADAEAIDPWRTLLRTMSERLLLRRAPETGAHDAPQRPFSGASHAPQDP